MVVVAATLVVTCAAVMRWQHPFYPKVAWNPHRSVQSPAPAVAAASTTMESRDSATVGAAQPALDAVSKTSKDETTAQQAGGTVPRADADLLSGGLGTGDGASEGDTLLGGGVPAPDLSANDSTAAAELPRAGSSAE